MRAELVATSGTAEDAQRLRELIEAAASEAGATGYTPQIAHGPEASVQAAAHPADTVLNGITGSIGLEPTLTALNSGYRVALANKESLIAGGPLVRAAVDASPLNTPMVPRRLRTFRPRAGARLRNRRRNRPTHPHRIGRPVPRLQA